MFNFTLSNGYFRGTYPPRGIITTTTTTTTTTTLEEL